MLNRVILMGRITHELEVKQTQSGLSVLSFTVAVQRNYAAKNEERQSDFISCVAWRQQADFIGRYFGKGRMIALEGNLRTRTYDDKNGAKHYVTEVYVESVSFTGEPKPNGNGGQQNNYANNNGYQSNQNNYQSQSTKPPVNPSMPEPPATDQMSIGNLADFEEDISDNGVPF